MTLENWNCRNSPPQKLGANIENLPLDTGKKPKNVPKLGWRTNIASLCGSHSPTIKWLTENPTVS